MAAEECSDRSARRSSFGLPLCPHRRRYSRVVIAAEFPARLISRHPPALPQQKVSECAVPAAEVSMANWWQVLARPMRRYDGPKPMTRAMIRKGRGASCVSAIPLSPVHVERPVSPVRDGWLCQALHKCC
jgi:hypothetical protein